VPGRMVSRETRRTRVLELLAGFTAAVLFTMGCSSTTVPPNKQSETLSKSEVETLLLAPPSVADVFHLRGECVALGKKIADNEDAVSGRTVRFTRTNYSVSANRCYVLISASQHGIIDNEKHTVDGKDVQATSTYDGQTGEQLAMVIDFGDGTPKLGFIGHTGNGVEPKPADYGEALDYINQLIDRDLQIP